MIDQTRNLFLYVPEPILRSICRGKKISIIKLRKLGIVQKMITEINSEEISKLIELYRYGGRGSVSWFIPTKNGKNVNITEEQIIDKVNKYCGNNPFEEELRPELDSHPKIISGKRLPDGKILIQMAHQEIRPQIFGFDITEEEQTKFSQFLIRRGSLFFEARTSRTKATEIADDIAQALGYDDSGQIKLSDVELKNLITELNAITISAKHKHPSGDFDTTEVVVSPQIHDLETSAAYLNGLAKLEGRRKRLGFDFKTDEGTINVKIEVYPKYGVVVFRSYVNERIIDYVFQAIKKVKGL
jgi:hypothetical protein